MEIIRNNLRAEGVSDDVANLAAESRRPSTIRTYNSRVTRFSDWCTPRKIAISSATLAEVTSFLKHIFDEGKQVSTIKNYRSAIAAIHSGFADGSSLGNNRVISQLLKGMVNFRPRVRLLAPSWSISAVLATLSAVPFEPLHTASLADLTHKTVFLLAVASARRRSCLHALSIKPGHMRFENQGVRCIPD
ncbi:site-specific integrase, partial [Salmonella sp. s55004]|uniref:site-specific integrase n=1 Tax=Salmonella sp. s55004 TaxID=3159675 RepID=UPI00397E9768